MHTIARKALLPLAGIVLFVGMVGAAYFYWRPPASEGPVGKAKDGHKHDDEHQHLHLSPQAKANLGLRVGKLALAAEPYWRTIKVSGVIGERPGNCERLISAPLAGVVKHIGAIPNEVVHPGRKLFTIEIVSDHLLSLQGNLFKTTRELQISRQEKDRLMDAFKSGAIPQTRMIEIENQLKRLQASLDAIEHELKVRGFKESDLAKISKGDFQTHITIAAPAFSANVQTHLAAAVPAAAAEDGGHAYEVEDLKVILGEQVQAGQALCLLADHHQLYIEGKVFASEASWIQKAAKEGWPIQVEFAGDTLVGWHAPVGSLKIAYLANRMDAASQTLRFFLNLANQHHEYERDGKKYRLWRFRPGQRVQLEVPVEPFRDVFVVPAEAIAREGPEAFVFRAEENASFFERAAVHVVYEDRRVALLANDGKLRAGQAIALNAAVQLNWALKVQGQEESPHNHDHEH